MDKGKYVYWKQSTPFYLLMGIAAAQIIQRSPFTMKNLKVHFSSITDHWSTPESIYSILDSEFHFKDDPCPLNGNGGLNRPWISPVFCNPPYSEISAWLKYGYLQSLEGKIVVFLIPSRTDTKYWHDYVMKAEEIRFIKGRLKFGGSKSSAPFPSCIVVFKGPSA